MKVRFIFNSKLVIYMMCLIVVITLLKNNKNLRVNLFGRKFSGYKYILLWTSPHTVPFKYMGEGQSVFLSRQCPYTNCIVTANRTLLGDYTSFDVIAFHGPELLHLLYTNLDEYVLPKRRSLHQKYVFASIESSQNYPICTNIFDNYFNWTWTYRLDSDLRWGYFLIRDSEGNIIGPKQHMQWLYWYAMSNVDAKMKAKLKSKTKAVAWFVSNCQTNSQRELYALGLQKYLRRKYKLKVDIFGECGSLNCSRDKEDECYKLIEKDYYFYLSFENAFSEDYVTEKLLLPLLYNAIPIVYGGADYSRFLPNGSYFNARELGIKKLSDKIYELIKNPDSYVDYFKWKNHYSYHRMSERPETDEYCNMCALLNDEEKLSQTTIYEYFQDWWDPIDASC